MHTCFSGRNQKKDFIEFCLNFITVNILISVRITELWNWGPV